MDPARSAEASCRFGDVEVDARRCRVVRGGVELALEPKAYGVLVELLRHAGSVVARDALLDAVWGHRHVTPAVLNRIIAILRRELGDDAEHPRLIRTVYGVGYEFIGASRTLPHEDVPESPASPSARVASPPPAAPSRRRVAWAAFALLAAAVLAAWWLWPRPPASSAFDGAAAADATVPTLVVMPLKPIGDEGAKVFAEGLGEELICSLARIEGLRVITHDSTLAAAASGEDTATLAQRLGITHSLEGNLQQSGQALRVRLHLVDVRNGRTVWVKDFDREAAEILSLQRDVAHDVATSLALRMGLIPEPVSPTGDAEFLRRAIAARALLARGDLPPEQSVDVAEKEFRALVQERPGDVRAQAGLALALGFGAMRHPERASALLDEAVREARVLRRLDPAQPESYSVEAHVACLRGDWETCLALKEKARDMAPSNTFVVYTNVLSLAELGYLDRAEALLRELLLRDPLNGAARLMHGRLLDAQGRHDGARAELEHVAGDAGARARWFNAVWRGDVGAAVRIAETDMAGGDDPLAASFVAVSRALADPASWPLAQAEFERSERDGAGWNVLRLLAPQSGASAAQAVAHLGAVGQNGYSSWKLLLWTKPLAWLRRDPAFADFIERTRILDYWRAHGFPPQCRADGDTARCD